jgi:hypothetical protein
MPVQWFHLQAGKSLPQGIEHELMRGFMQSFQVIGEKVLYGLALEASGAFGGGSSAIPHAIVCFGDGRNVTLAEVNFREV